MKEDNEDGNEDGNETEGFPELDMVVALQRRLEILKRTASYNRRGWAIACTDAEKLHAWIGYVLSMAMDEEEATK